MSGICYEISEYRNMFIPDGLRHLMGTVSREEMQHIISVESAKTTYILKDIREKLNKQRA